MKVKLNGRVCSNGTAALYRRWGHQDLCCPADVDKAIAECPVGEELVFEVNSGGGSAYAGIEMFTLVRQCKLHTVAEVQSIAGSAMSVFLAGCDEVRISPAANVMIHRAGAHAEGNAQVMGETKQMLDTIDEGILNAYEEKVNGKTSREDLQKMMESETFMTAQRAIEVGFADSILEGGGERANPALAVASMGGEPGDGSTFLFAELPAVEDLLRMEEEMKKKLEGGEAVALEGANDAGQGKEPLNIAPAGPGVQDMKNEKRSEEGMEEIENVEQMEEKYPELTAQIRQEAAEQAAKAERERIEGIDAVAMEGFEEIITEAKADPKQNAGTVALAIVKAQKEQGEKFLSGRKSDAAEANKVPAAEAVEPPEKEEKEAEDESEAAKAAVAAVFGTKKEEKE